MKILYACMIAGALGLGFTGCGGSDHESASKLIGVWSAPAYGKVWEIRKISSGNKAKPLRLNFDVKFRALQYDVTSTTCFANTLSDVSGNELSLSQLIAVFKLQKNERELEQVEEGQTLTPGVSFFRVESLPDSCAGNQIAVKGDEAYEFNAEQDFLIFWQTLSDLYLDFGLSQTDWQSTYAEFFPLALAAENEDDLFAVFSEMIEPLEDGHTIILTGDLSQGLEAALDADSSEVFSVSYKPSIDELLIDEFIEIHQLTPPFTFEDIVASEDYVEEQFEIIFDSIVAHAENLDEIGDAANGEVVWFKTEENIGYIFIGSMSELSEDGGQLRSDKRSAYEAIAEALGDLADVEGIIIDVRLNGGGYDEVSMEFASRFTSSALHVYSKQARLGNSRTPLIDVNIRPRGETQFLGPVVVLTSADTYSAAEVFALAMSALPNVTLIGEASGGSFSDILVSRVSSDIAFGFSNEFYLSVAGDWFERDGVPVDIEVPFATKDQRDTGVDLGIERAIEFLSRY